MTGGRRDDDRREGWWPEGDERGEEEAKTAREPARRPPRGLASPDRPRRGSRYSWFVGLAFFALIVIAMLNLLRSDDSGIIGAGYGQSGSPLPAFAVPEALSGVDADANVFQDDCESSRNPCPADQVRTPACEVDAAGAIRVCDLFDRPLAISFWFTRGGDCLPTQDAFDEVARSFPGKVNFLSVDIRDDPGSVAEIVRSRGWTVMVGYDRDGAVSNLYRVGVCPTIVYAFPGGILDEAEIGDADRTTIRRHVESLLTESRRREAEVR
jgi:thiol-disulfide isomerase/thioredoxin